MYLWTTWRSQAWLCGAALVGYWAIMTVIPVPIDIVIRESLDRGTVPSQAGPVSVVGVRRVSDHAIAAYVLHGLLAKLLATPLGDSGW